MIHLPAPSFVDFHTHYSGCDKYVNRPEVFVVQSCMWGIDTIHPRANAVTLGIHPMQRDAAELMGRYSGDLLAEDFQNFCDRISVPVIGIGECGWDRRSTLNPEEQDKLVSLQADLAIRLSLPLILHNVGATHKVLALRKSLPQNCEIWHHGFRSKAEIYTQLLDAGVHISLHPKASQNLQVTADLFRQGFLRLETDDEEVPVNSLYSEWAARLEVDPADLLVDSL